MKEKNFRLTPQRMAVIKILSTSQEHLSVEDIYQRVKEDFPVTSLATIYKTINVLKNVGELMELGFGDDRNRYDGIRPFPHPHLICTQCRKILDPDLPTLSELSKELEEKTGFQIVDHRLDFFGICPECQRKKSIL
ncbi:MAG: Fur family transcriptional regulator [Thermodesulfobacteriota bacterium]